MLGPDGLYFPAASSLPMAYIGLGPGQELIPYFWALVVLAGTMFIAVLQWPIALLRRAFAGNKIAAPSEPTAQPSLPLEPESPREGTPDKP